MSISLLWFDFLSAAGNQGRVKIYRDKLGTYRTNLAAAGGVHTSPELIRMEVAITKTDFNMRLKQVLFNCILSAYYAGFIPAAFSPRFVKYCSPLPKILNE